jgi:hypothetical protein
MRHEWWAFTIACAVILAACGALVGSGLETTLYDPSVPVIWVQVPRVFLVGTTLLAIGAVWRARDRLGRVWLVSLISSLALALAAVLNIWHTSNPLALQIPTTTPLNLISVWALVGVQFGFWQSLAESRVHDRAA